MARHRGGGSRGSRGSRGRGRGGGRGGYLGGKKGRGRGRGGLQGHQQAPDPMMVDLGGDPDVYIPEKSMRATAKRTRAPKMMAAGLDRDDSEDKRPLRKRPVDFTKSDKLGDAANVTVLMEREMMRVSGVIVDPIVDQTDVVQRIDQEIIEVNLMVSNEGDGELSDSTTGISEESKEELDQDLAQDLPEPTVPKPIDPMVAVPNDSLFFVDDTGSPPTHIRTAKEEHIEPAPVPSGPNTEFTPTLSFGHVHLSTSVTDRGETVTQLPKITKKLNNINSFDPEQSFNHGDSLDELEGQFLDESNAGNTDLYRSYQKYITNVMGNLFENREDDDAEDEEEFAELDDDFEDEAMFMAEGVSNDNPTIEQKTSSNVQDLQIEETTPDSEDSEDPEFGFLAEDYESFDISLVDVFNIREGYNSSQYHIKSFRLLGSYETHWVDRVLFEDFLTEHGMPEHRLNAYFKYLKSRLEPEDEPKSDYDIRFSDSEEDEQDHYDVGQDQGMTHSDEEGLDDLISFTTKYDRVRDLEFETKTIKTKGKGRKKHLDLDAVAGDFGEALQNQWAQDRQRKREKRDLKNSNIAVEHSQSQDLSLKYPYQIFIKDIRAELEEFLADGGRKSLTFPPLDPHGNRTIQNMVHAFNMKSRKFGSGSKQHVVVIKNKRTFRTLPDYNSIDRLMRQRPVFNRTDQKRSRAEIDSEKSSRRGVPSKAHVKEGDIVGGDAPEIASDNFGRRLLLKMGWKTGQGLGLDNTGISEPVMATVKKTKLGIR